MFVCIDQFNNYFLLFENNYFELTLSPENEFSSIRKTNVTIPNITFSGYIQGISSNPISNKNEIILYGISKDVLYFYYVSEKQYYNVSITKNNDGQISCKLIVENYYICAYLHIDHAHLLILSDVDKKLYGKLEIVDDIIEIDFFDNLILYDTSVFNYKILCSSSKMNDKSDEIECEVIYIREINTNLKYDLDIYKIKDNQAIFSYESKNCNFTKINSEYLFCCGGEDIIYCDRRDENLNLINNFTINNPGRIRNLTLEFDEGNIKLLFSNYTNITFIYE